MMTAAAHRLDDDEQPDSEEAEMPEAAFAVIQRARRLYGHPAPRELPTELEQRDCLIVRATKILGAQIRAGKLVADEMKAKGERCDVEDFIDGFELGDDEPDDLGTDWASVAQAAWHEGWRAAAEDYHRTRRGVCQ
jgi:hypothetical protein